MPLARAMLMHWVPIQRVCIYVVKKYIFNLFQQKNASVEEIYLVEKLILVGFIKIEYEGK